MKSSKSKTNTKRESINNKQSQNGSSRRLSMTEILENAKMRNKCQSTLTPVKNNTGSKRNSQISCEK